MTITKVLQIFGARRFQDGQRKARYSFGGDVWEDFCIQPAGIDIWG